MKNTHAKLYSSALLQRLTLLAHNDARQGRRKSRGLILSPRLSRFWIARRLDRGWRGWSFRVKGALLVEANSLLIKANSIVEGLASGLTTPRLFRKPLSDF